MAMHHHAVEKQEPLIVMQIKRQMSFAGRCHQSSPGRHWAIQQEVAGASCHRQKVDLEALECAHPQQDAAHVAAACLLCNC